MRRASVIVTQHEELAKRAARVLNSYYGPATASVEEARGAEYHVRIPERLIDEASAVLYGNNRRRWW